MLRLPAGGVALVGLLDEWPVPRPSDWPALINAPQTEADERRAGQSIRRGRPLGEPLWVEKVVRRLGLGHTLRKPGRPRKTEVPG
jgi:hypothetical protein